MWGLPGCKKVKAGPSSNSGTGCPTNSSAGSDGGKSSPCSDSGISAPKVGSAPKIGSSHVMRYSRPPEVTANRSPVASG